MKQEFIIDKEDEKNLSYYYGEWHVSGLLELFLDENQGKKLKITVEVLED